MAQSDVFWGNQTWNDYITAKDQVAGFRESLQRQTSVLVKAQNNSAMEVRLNQRNYEIALESGLGAVGNQLDSMGDMFSSGLGELTNSIELGFDNLSRGIDQLNADFNLLMGDVIWRLELQDRSLQSILQTLQAPLDTQAKELRHRAEDAYQNGWYEESLADFLESEKKNYQDFSVHRSIGNIYLYHLINLPKALEYFQKASKYARPRDERQAAEAEYFAGITCAAQQNITKAFQHIQNAISLNRRLYEARYMKATFASILGDELEVLAGLEMAIQGDGRYYERAKTDKIFDAFQGQVNTLLNEHYVYKQDDAKEIGNELIADIQEVAKSLLPEDKENLNTVIEKIQGFLRTEKSYIQYQNFIQEESFFRNELEKAKSRKADYDKKKSAEKERLRKQREADARTEQERLKKEGETKAKKVNEAISEGFALIGISIFLAVIAYPIVGIGGCIIRVGNSVSWSKEAFYIPIAIIAIGILSAVIMVIKAKN